MRQGRPAQDFPRPCESRVKGGAIFSLPGLWLLPSHAIGATGARLTPPWPDLVIACGSNTTRPALAIKRASGGLTVAGTGAIVTTLVAGGAITVLVAAPVAVGAATLLGGLCVVGYFYSTARKQAKTGKLLGIMLKEGDRPSDGSAKD